MEKIENSSCIGHHVEQGNHKIFLLNMMLCLRQLSPERGSASSYCASSDSIQSILSSFRTHFHHWFTGKLTSSQSISEKSVVVRAIYIALAGELDLELEYRIIITWNTRPREPSKSLDL